jgi:two-component system chemotaxis response regulator CheY
LRAVGGSDAHGLGADVVDPTNTDDEPGSEHGPERAAVGATVLIVDDERDIRFLLRFVLEKNGYRVVEAVHGASALDLIRDERPALVITDLMMPVMDGGELIGSLRGADGTAQIPAILVSACPERAPKDRFDIVMRKPFLPSELVAAVHELLEKRSGA